MLLLKMGVWLFVNIEKTWEFAINRYAFENKKRYTLQAKTHISI